MGTVYGADKTLTTKTPYHADDKTFTTLSAAPPPTPRIHVHHPALLTIARLTTQGEEVILDNISSLAEGRLESDVIFPTERPAKITVTILTGKRYTFTIN